MIENNDVVTIDLDRPRELRYGHKALKKLSAMTGKKITEIDIAGLDVEEIEKVVYCGLLTDAKEHNENLKIEDMEDLLDKAPSFVHIVTKIGEAFQAAFGGTEGNQNLPEKPAAEQ